jgi:glycosyltransferase involved in cell wall biosynthesis
MQEGESAILVPTHSPESLASAIQKIITDDSRKNQLIENGLRNVKERFDQRNQLEEIVKLYNLLLKPAAGGG